MKVVFLGDLRSESNSGAQRFWAMQQCGIDVYAVDKQHYPSRFRKWSHHIAKLAAQPNLLTDSARLSRDLIKLCQHIKPDIVWLEWAREFGTDTILQLKQLKPRPMLISFQDDNPWGERYNDQWMWKNYIKLIPFFDLHLVKRKKDMLNLKSFGAISCRLWQHGIFSPLFHPSSFPINQKYPVSFVGTCMDDRPSFIGYLLEHKIPIHVFGNRWSTHSDLPARFPTFFHPAVEGKLYAQTVRDSQICLGLVSHSNHDEWTMRSYEVPGCAIALLAERTPAHKELFVEDEEAVFFETPEECAEKIHYLLQSPDLCAEIGKAAFKKFSQNDWTIESRMNELLCYLEATKLPTALHN